MHFSVDNTAQCVTSSVSILLYY